MLNNGLTHDQKVEISRGIMLMLDDVGKTSEAIEKIWEYQDYENRSEEIKTRCKTINHTCKEINSKIRHTFGLYSNVMKSLAEIEAIMIKIGNKGYKDKYLIDLIFEEIDKVKKFIKIELFNKDVNWNYHMKRAA